MKKEGHYIKIYVLETSYFWHNAYTDFNNYTILFFTFIPLILTVFIFYIV